MALTSVCTHNRTDIEKVTAADVQRVSNSIFRAENRTVGILEPQEKSASGATK